MSTKEIANQEVDYHQIRLDAETGNELDLLGAQHFIKEGKKLSRNRIVNEWMAHGIRSGKLEKFMAQYLK